MEKTCPAYVSKHNSNPENQLRMPYLEVKKLSALLIGITSKHDGEFYCLNCLHSFAIESKRESHKKVCNNKD